MAEPLKKLTIKGFKSIESLVDFELRPLNVLIGANGSGKSNFVDFFRMLRAMARDSLQRFVIERGGGRTQGFFFMGPKHTPRVQCFLEAGDLRYDFTLSYSAPGLLRGRGVERLSGAPFESAEQAVGATKEFEKRILGCVVYHFQDTGWNAPMRSREQAVRDCEYLREDASNIAAFLLRLREEHKGNYDLIRDTVRIVAPFFDDFKLRPQTSGPEQFIALDWEQKGSEILFLPHDLSDGMIRFICLATALLQPDPPATIVIDEPELGLHPFAIVVLGGLIGSASARTQVIVSTQSPALLDEFKVEDIIVVDREKGHSTFSRLNEGELREWLAEYSIAELWQKNVLRGGPAHE